MGSFDREALLKRLTSAAPALAKSDLIRERTHFWLSEKHVYAFDGGLGIEMLLPADAPVCGVPGRVFISLLNSSSLDKVQLELVDAQLVLQLGKAKVKIDTLDYGRRSWPFKDVGDEREEGEFTISLTEPLFEALKKAFLVKASKPDHIIQHGVIVASTGKSIQVFATDHRSIVQLTVKQKSTIPTPVLLPWAFVKVVLDLVKAPAELRVRSNCLFVEGDGVCVYSNKLDYPAAADDLGSVVESHMQGDGVALPKELRLVLDRAYILAGDASNSAIDISTSGSSLLVRGRWAAGSIDEKLDLGESVDTAGGTFLADVVSRGLAYANQFFISTRSLVLSDDDGSFIYVSAARASGKKDASPAPEPAEPKEPAKPKTAKKAAKEAKPATRRRKAA